MSDSLILRPGDVPPDVQPYCQICDMPVERMQFDLVKDGSADVIGIHASCCNRTSSTRIPLSMYLQMRATGAKLYVIVRKGSQAGLRGRSHNLRSVG